MDPIGGDLARPGRHATPALLVAIGIAALAAALLGVQLVQDPVPGFTVSDSPFTDEGWSVLGARNQALLGAWSTDEWELFWAQLPFNFAALAAFEIGGVGIIQARLVAVVCSVLGVGLLADLLARRVGVAQSIIASAGLATSTLLLYYGRLAVLEPMVVLFLVLGFSMLLGGWPRRPFEGGIAAGSALALAMATKPSSGFAVAGMLVGALLAGGAVAGLRRRIGVAAAVIGVSGSAWLVVVLAQPGLLASILRIWPQQELPGSIVELWERAGTYAANSDGALAAAAPLLIGAAVGVGTGVATWRRLEPSRRAMLAAATGWFVAGLLILVVVPYRPNRYVVPLLPALAVLTALGVAMVADRVTGIGNRTRLAVVAMLVVAIATPGVIAVGSWTSAATYRLPAIQATMLELIADPAPIEGGPAATLAMRVPAPAITARPFVNAGDLYDEYGVRWLLIGPTMQPAWAGEHAEAWAAREVIECFDWPSGEVCLVRVP
jgi:4-amino-4-deoxy-L-arabinose transferase-like glycosyltransferase